MRSDDTIGSPTSSKLSSAAKSARRKSIAKPKTLDVEQIRVAVRLRPLEAGAPRCVSAAGDTGIVKMSSADASFAYDHAFGEQASTNDVFQKCGSICESIFDGINATIFAYGQTGSVSALLQSPVGPFRWQALVLTACPRCLLARVQGKTHTMMGSASAPGIIPLAIKLIWEQIKSTRCSCLVGMVCLLIADAAVTSRAHSPQPRARGEQPWHQPVQDQRQVCRGVQ